MYVSYIKHYRINPLPPMSDRDRISHYNINTISSRQVMRIKKNINQRSTYVVNLELDNSQKQVLFNIVSGQITSDAL